MTPHQKATLLARESACLVCGTTPSEPCHTVHRGMGGAKAGWEANEWVPLCRKHHDEYDKRLGVSALATEHTRITKYIVSVRGPEWQRAHASD